MPRIMGSLLPGGLLVVQNQMHLYPSTPPPIHDCDAVGGALITLFCECKTPAGGRQYIYRHPPLRPFMIAPRVEDSIKPLGFRRINYLVLRMQNPSMNWGKWPGTFRVVWHFFKEYGTLVVIRHAHVQTAVNFV